MNADRPAGRSFAVPGLSSSKGGGCLLLRRSRPAPLCRALFFTTKITPSTSSGQAKNTKRDVFCSRVPWARPTEVTNLGYSPRAACAPTRAPTATAAGAKWQDNHIGYGVRGVPGPIPVLPKTALRRPHFPRYTTSDTERRRGGRDFRWCCHTCLVGSGSGLS